LQTTDGTAARRRAVSYVERRIQEIVQASDPHARTLASGVHASLDEYVQDLIAIGNTRRQACLVQRRIERVLAEAKITEYSQLDAVRAVKAIASLQAKGEFSTTTTANRYREALRAWSRWMKRHGRWPMNVLEEMPKFKGDVTLSRRRAILTEEQFANLLTSTRQGPTRRHLSGELRHWLYLIASQTGLRAQELHSLTPQSFRLNDSPPFLEISCTVSKRRTTDRIELHPEFAKLVAVWLRGKPRHRGLWSDSKAWFDKAAAMLRDDLKAAGLPSTISTPDGPAVIDFHSFRCYRVTQAIMTGANSRVVLATVRLSCEALLDRYAKIPSSEVTACTMAIPLPSVLQTQNQSR
jgi:integrase